MRSEAIPGAGAATTLLAEIDEIDPDQPVLGVRSKRGAFQVLSHHEWNSP